MPILFLTLLLFSMPIFCAEAEYDPAVIIRRNIRQPDAAIKGLSALGTSLIRNYRDDKYNNLLHIAVLTLIQQKDQPDYANTVEKSKPLFRFLALNGEVNINEANDDYMTPVFYAHRALDVESKTRTMRANTDPLSVFLENELGAYPIQVDSMFEVDIRAFKKQLRAAKEKLSNIICCKSRRRIKQ